MTKYSFATHIMLLILWSHFCFLIRWISPENEEFHLCEVNPKRLRMIWSHDKKDFSLWNVIIIYILEISRNYEGVGDIKRCQYDWSKKLKKWDSIFQKKNKWQIFYKLKWWRIAYFLTLFNVFTLLHVKLTSEL